MRAFEALSDPTRRKIILMLAKKERMAGAIAKKFAMTAPAISQHLNVLKAAKLVRMRVAAQKRIYKLDAVMVAKAGKWLSKIAKPPRKPRKKASARKRR